MTTIHDLMSGKSLDRKTSSAGISSASDQEHLSRFSQDFSEAASSSAPSSLAPESLSSASSFQSLASTLSSKSSSGICVDSAPGSPDKPADFDHSYVNVDIPDLDDLISACANINLNVTQSLAGAIAEEADVSADLSQDQTFTSAADDTVADETQLIANLTAAEESIQTFQTCPVLEQTQISKVESTTTRIEVFKAPLPVVSNQATSVIPYVTFEDSVLRKHQSELDGSELQSSLPSFQIPDPPSASLRYSPTPCIEIDVLEVAKSHASAVANLVSVECEVALSTCVAVNDKKEQSNVSVASSSDVSSEQGLTLNSTVILNPESQLEESVAQTPQESSLNFSTNEAEKTSLNVLNNKAAEEIDSSPLPEQTLVKQKNSQINIKSEDEIVESKKLEEDIVEKEPVLNSLNQTKDTVQEFNILNKTQDIIQDPNTLNKTQEVVKDFILNQTQNIIKPSKLDTTQDIIQEGALNKTQDVKDTNALNKTQDIVKDTNVLNKTQEIVKDTNVLNKTQDIVKEHLVQDLIEDKNPLNKNEDIIQENNNLNDKTEVIVTSEETNTLSHKEEAQFITPNSQLIISSAFVKKEVEVPLPEPKSPVERILVVNEIKTPIKSGVNPCEDTNSLNTEVTASTPLHSKSSNKKNRSALFSPEFKSPLKRSSHIKVKELEALNKTGGFKEENNYNLEETVSVNKTFDTLEATHILPPESSVTLPPPEPEYEAFKPQVQSTSLPYSDCCDFAALQQAALEVAKDIDASLETIEESEHFISATTELFGDPSAFDFLNQVGSQPSKRTERYDSLYMRFDPLAQRLSMLPQKNMPTSLSAEEEEDVKETKAEPTLNATPKKNPAIAAIDRLLFYSPVPTSAETEVAEAKPKKEEVEKQEPQVPVVDEKMAKELELVRSTVLQLEGELEKQKREHKEQLERQKASFDEKLSHVQTKFTQMQTQLTQEVKCKDQMTVVVEEYEKSISRLIAEREKDRTNFEMERAKLQEELQVANQHLSNTEAAFSDVHSKYERLKNVVSAYKSNETVLKESIAENQETIKTLENRYEQLKSHAMAQLEKANLELSSIKKQNEAETMKLKALVRKAELKSKSLEETVEQKMKENKELTQIIDEMIARVD